MKWEIFSDVVFFLLLVVFVVGSTYAFGQDHVVSDGFISIEYFTINPVG